MPNEINNLSQLEILRNHKAYLLSCFENYGYGGDFREACRIQDEIDRLESLAPGPQVQKLEKLNEL